MHNFDTQALADRGRLVPLLGQPRYVSVDVVHVDSGSKLLKPLYHLLGLAVRAGVHNDEREFPGVPAGGLERIGHLTGSIHCADHDRGKLTVRPFGTVFG